MANPELNLVFIPALAWLLFSLGGSKISEEIPGWKGWRRFILPAVFLVACFINGIIWWKSILAILPCWAYCMGYGERASYLKKFFIGCLYGLIGVAIGISWWNLATIVGFITLFKLSNTKLVAHIFVWKIIEGMYGLFCGIQLGYLLAGNGTIW